MNLGGLIAASPLAWVELSALVNENQRRIEFHNHRFMLDVYADNHSDITCVKSAQCGFSVYAILKSFHELKYERRNVLYALPTRNIVQDFVVPKVNPLISSNPTIAADMGSDSVSLKRLGDRFIFFKGGSEREAISVTADTLVIDEYDRMPDMNVVTMFDSRLQAAEEPRRRRFSNPSGVDFGVDALYQESDQMHWMIRCSHCAHEWFIDLDQGDDKRHHIDRAIQQFVCGKCHRPLTDEDRRMGRWVPKYPSRTHRRGYWISQMMAPWVSAQRILTQEEEMDTATFHAFVLGKAYTPSDLIVSREAILRATAPGRIPTSPVAMGVDQAADGQYYVLMTPRGVLSYGKTKSWEDIEHIKLTYDATLVCDPNPYPTQPKAYAHKYPDWYLCYFKPSTDLSFVQWKNKIVYADRTRLLDTVATEIVQGKLLFRQRPSELEEYIRDWSNIYRTTQEEPDGRVKSIWMKKESRNSDFSFATAYARLALSRLLGGLNSQLIEPGPELSWGESATGLNKTNFEGL